MNVAKQDSDEPKWIEMPSLRNNSNNSIKYTNYNIYYHTIILYLTFLSSKY